MLKSARDNPTLNRLTTLVEQRSAMQRELVALQTTRESLQQERMKVDAKTAALRLWITPDGLGLTPAGVERMQTLVMSSPHRAQRAVDSSVSTVNLSAESTPNRRHSFAAVSEKQGPSSLEELRAARDDARSIARELRVALGHNESASSDDSAVDAAEIVGLLLGHAAALQQLRQRVATTRALQSSPQ